MQIRNYYTIKSQIQMNKSQIKSNKPAMKMKSVSNAQQQQLSNSQQQAPIPPSLDLFAPQQQQPSFTNAQQQQFSNVQQQAPIQFPLNPFPNPQQQASFTNAQVAQMQIPQQQIPQQMYQQNNMLGNPYNNIPSSNVGYYGGGFGTRDLQPQQQLALFNDDQVFQESVKDVTTSQGKLQISLKAQRSQVKLGEKTVLPAMCSITASGGSRTSVDLICVIDVSGSMSGQKIQLVRETLRFLIETLTPSDRLSLITFNSTGRRICPLRTVTQENMVGFSANINGLTASGGTSIMSGLNLGLKTIRDRKIPNKVTSIFLLSDGQDKGAEQSLRLALKNTENADLGVFSIHSFGFGTDHDQDLMNKICTMKDGSFYFIKQLDTLDEAFCNALGGIISLVASEVIIQVRNVAQGLVEGVKISKVYGDKWQKVGEGEYRIKFTQIMTDSSKDFVLELTVPEIGGEVGDIGREHVVLEGLFSAKGVLGQQMGGATALSLTLINTHESIAEQLQNVDVIENYLRVKATEAIQQNMKKAEDHKYEQAQKGIDLMINNIQGNTKARKQKMQHLVNDLQVIRQKCSKKEYEQEGKKYMVSATNAHSQKANFAYSNCIQSEMVNQRQQQKSKKMG